MRPAGGRAGGRTILTGPDGAHFVPNNKTPKPMTRTFPRTPRNPKVLSDNPNTMAKQLKGLQAIREL